MKLWKKGFSMVMAASLMAAAFTGSAMAAEDRTKITKVDLTVDSNIETGDDMGDVNVTTSDSTYSVTEIEITNDDGEWVSGDVPRVEITLEADDDYYFTSMSSSKVKLRGDDATYVSSHRSDSNATLVITIKLDALEGSMEIESVQWENENAPIATWEEADGAKSYQLRLYRGSSSVGESITTTNTWYNLSDRFSREGEYYFKVRAVNSSNKKGDWYESDSVYVDEDLLADIKAGNYTTSNSASSGSTTNSPNTSSGAQWVQNSTGWWYRFADGSWPANGWLQINNLWYCFDASGYMRTGWIQTANGNWYYCGSNGAMLTNTTTPDGFRVDANGVWIH